MTDPPNECLFCQLSAGVIILENDLALAIPDRFEVTKLHTLVIPKRHVIDYFSLNAETFAERWRGVPGHPYVQAQSAQQLIASLHFKIRQQCWQPGLTFEQRFQVASVHSILLCRICDDR
jgi:hypothetical protein